MRTSVDVPRLSDEGRTSSLLWQICSPHLSLDTVAATVDTGIDATRTAAAAADHGLTALLWRALRLAGRDGSLGRSVELVRAQAELLRFQATLLLPSAVRMAVEPLTDAGLEPLVFKGPALSARYPEPGLRPMGDIDLVLPAPHHEKAVNALRSSGWKVVRATDRLHYDTALAHPEVPSLDLELHHELFSWHDRPNGLRTQELWDRRVPIDCLGTPAFGLAAEDELIALVAHAGKPFHCFGRLIWIADLATVMADAVERDAIDWDLVRARAARARCETVLAVGLAQASRTGGESPADLKQITASETRRAALSPLLRPDWPLTPLDTGLRNRLRYALADDARHRILLFLGAPVHEPIKRWPGRLLSMGLRATRRWWRLRRSRRE